MSWVPSFISEMSSWIWGKMESMGYPEAVIAGVIGWIGNYWKKGFLAQKAHTSNPSQTEDDSAEETPANNSSSTVEEEAGGSQVPAGPTGMDAEGVKVEKDLLQVLILKKGDKGVVGARAGKKGFKGPIIRNIVTHENGGSGTGMKTSESVEGGSIFNMVGSNVAPKDVAQWEAALRSTAPK